MKVIIKNGKKVTSSVANSDQRRAYNRKNGTNFSKEEFDLMVAMARMTNGLDENTMKALQQGGLAHFDNEKLVPTGTEVKLNYEEISKRKKEDMSDAYVEWVEENKDKVFHLFREENKQSLVCLEEDQRTVEVNGEKQIAPRWLFDLYYDILVEYNGEWIPVYQYEEEISASENSADSAEESTEENVND